MATIVASASGGTRAWSDTNTWVGGVVPTAADSVQIAAASGNVTIDTGAVCRGLDCTTYTGTLTHNAAATLTIGDATAALSNIALKLVSGMTYTLGNATTSAINFISTSATVQTVDFAGKTSGNVTYNATSNGSWQMTGTHNTGVTATVTLTKGTLDVNAQTCSWGLFNSNNSNVRSLTLGAAAITVTGASANVWDISTATSLTLSAASSTITCNGAGVTIAGGGSKTYGTVNLTGSGTAQLNGTGVIYTNLNRTGTAVGTDAISYSAVATVTGIWTLAGNSITNRLLVQSNTLGTARTITNSGATQTWSNVDFMDITLGTAYDASAITGGSGDGGGNANITFTTAATQTWSGTSGGTWSGNAWSGRVPLPQDDVVINAAFSASQTVTTDMVRLGKSISWAGATGSPTWSAGAIANASMFGSLTLISGMSLTTAQTLTLRGRGSHTITSAGKTIPSAVTVMAPGGTYTLQDAFSASGVLSLTNGGLDANNFNVTIPSLAASSSNTRSLTAGTGTWTLTATGTQNIWNFTVTTALTFSGASATYVVSAASANTRTFVGGGQTFGTLTYTVAGSTGALVITGANTLLTINFSDASNARTLTLPSSATTTVTTFNVNGTSGKLMTINSSTPGTAATLSKASGTVSSDYLSIQDSAATGGAAWYAGANSTNVSGNTGWIFSPPPVVTTSPIMVANASAIVPSVSAKAAVTGVIMAATASMVAPTLNAKANIAAPVMVANASMLVPALNDGANVTSPIMVATASMPTPVVTSTVVVSGGRPGRRPPPWPPWSG